MLLAAGADKEAKDEVRGLGMTEGKDRECFSWFAECRYVGPRNAPRFGDVREPQPKIRSQRPRCYPPHL